MAGGVIHISNSTSLDPPLAINYDNYQKSLAYWNFSHLAPLICSFLRKDIVKKGAGALHNVLLHNYAPDYEEEHYCNELQVL